MPAPRAHQRKEEERDAVHTYPARAANPVRDRRLLRHRDVVARRGQRARRDLDEGRRVPRDPRQLQQGRRDQGRAAERARTCSCSSRARRPAAPTSCRSRSGSCRRPRAGRSGRSSVARTCSRISRSSTWPRRARPRASQLFDYYLGYLTNPTIKRRTSSSIPDSTVQYAKQWGMSVAVEDLHRVIGAARKLGRQGRARRPLARRLGRDRVRDLGLQRPRRRATTSRGWSTSTVAAARAESAPQARAALAALNAPSATPWLSFGGIPAPFAGLFNATGSLGGAARSRRAVARPEVRAAAGTASSPPVPATNLGAVRVRAQRRHLAAEPGRGAGPPRQGLSPPTGNGLHGWDGTGALTPIERFATMFSGFGHQQRRRHRVVLPAAADRRHRRGRQRHRQPRAEGAGRARDDGHGGCPGACGSTRSAPRSAGRGCSQAATALATQSGIPTRNLTLVNRQRHLRPQRPGRRVPGQRVLQAPDAVPEDGRPRLTAAALTRAIASATRMSRSPSAPDVRGSRPLETQSANSTSSRRNASS